MGNSIMDYLDYFRALEEFECSNVDELIEKQLGKSYTHIRNLNDESLNIVIEFIHEGIDIQFIFDKKLSNEKIKLIYHALKNGKDYMYYARLNESVRRSTYRLYCEINKLPYEKYAHLDDDYLIRIIYAHRNNIDLSKYDIESHSPKEFGMIIKHEAKYGYAEYLHRKHVPAEAKAYYVNYIEKKIDGDFKSSGKTMLLISKGLNDILINAKKVLNSCKTAQQDFKEWVLDWIEYYLMCNVEAIAPSLQEMFMDNAMEFLGIDSVRPKINLGDGGYFTKEQLEEIEEGIEYGLDISKFAKYNLESYSIKFIVDNLKRDIDLSEFVYPGFTLNQLELIAQIHAEGIDINKIVVPNLSYEHLLILYKDLVSGLDVSDYKNPKLSLEEVKHLSQLNKKEQNSALERLNL